MWVIIIYNHVAQIQMDDATMDVEVELTQEVEVKMNVENEETE